MPERRWLLRGTAFALVLAQWLLSTRAALGVLSGERPLPILIGNVGTAILPIAATVALSVARVCTLRQAVARAAAAALGAYVLGAAAYFAAGSFTHGYSIRGGLLLALYSAVWSAALLAPVIVYASLDLPRDAVVLAGIVAALTLMPLQPVLSLLLAAALAWKRDAVMRWLQGSLRLT